MKSLQAIQIEVAARDQPKSHAFTPILRMPAFVGDVLGGTEDQKATLGMFALNICTYCNQLKIIPLLTKPEVPHTHMTGIVVAVGDLCREHSKMESEVQETIKELSDISDALKLSNGFKAAQSKTIGELLWYLDAYIRDDHKHDNLLTIVNITWDTLR